LRLASGSDKQPAVEIHLKHSVNSLGVILERMELEKARQPQLFKIDISSEINAKFSGFILQRLWTKFIKAH
jgi:hypothetical protein